MFGGLWRRFLLGPVNGFQSPFKDTLGKNFTKSKLQNLYIVFSRSSSEKAKSKGNYKGEVLYQIICPEKYEEAIVHMRNSFFANEPLTKALDIVKRGEKHEDLEEMILQNFRQGVSIMAVDKKTNEVIGMMINGYKTDECDDEEVEIKDPKFKKIADFLKIVDEGVEFLAQYKPGEVFEFKMLSVDPKFKGNRFGEKLGIESENLARSQGFKLIRADTTAFLSQIILEKLGFESIKEIVYSEYPSKESPLFKAEPPNTSFKLMVKKIDCC